MTISNNDDDDADDNDDDCDILYTIPSSSFNIALAVPEGHECERQMQFRT